ncbi:MAG: methyltransferase [Methanoregula sp.]
MVIPCISSHQYITRQPDPSLYHERKCTTLTGTCQEDAVLKSFLLPPEAEPDVFYRQVNSMATEACKFFALMSATGIRIFDHLTVPVTCEAVAEKFPKSDQIPELLAVLCECGFVRKDNGTYVNTPLAAAFLDSESPYSQEEYMEKLRIRMHELWYNLPEIIRQGPVYYNKKEFFSRMVLPSMAANALTGRLQHVVRAIMELPGTSGHSRMLDLGGGHGLYAIALARLNPEMECTVFDLPEVISVTQEYIDRYQVKDRVGTLGGDFFKDDFGSGYNLILSSSNPSGKRTDMIPRISAALSSGGYFVNVQGGDVEKEKTCISELEARMWRFSDEPEWRTRGGKRRPLLTDPYFEALTKSDIEVVSIMKIQDSFRMDDAVTMTICQKPDRKTDKTRMPLAMGVYGCIQPPWTGPAAGTLTGFSHVQGSIKRANPVRNLTDDC